MPSVEAEDGSCLFRLDYVCVHRRETQTGARLSRHTEERRAVRAVLLAPQGTVLLACAHRPGDGKQIWFTPGGGLEPDEDHLTGLRRELFEETGFEVEQIGSPIWTRHHEFDWGLRRISQHETFYLISTQPFEPESSGNPDPEEASAFEQHQWMTPTQMRHVSGTLVPARLPELVETLLNEGPPAAPFDVGV